MRRIAVVLSLLVASVALPLAAQSGAGAAAKPAHLTLHTLKMRINLHDSGHFVYHAFRLKPGSVVVLQRRVVGSGTWSTFSQTPPTVGSTSGTFNVGPLDHPEHSQYRSRVVRNGHVSLQTGVHDLFVYTKVTMATLCTGILDGTCHAGTSSLPSFGYVMTTPISAASDPWTAALHGAKTSCQSITFRYLSALPSAANTTHLELRQKGRAAQKHSSAANKIGKFTAKLNGNKWAMGVAQNDPQALMFFNGSASCWSTTGAR